MVVKPTNVPMQPDHGDVKDVVHQVVVDGRFIDEFATNPNAVTNHLGITVAKETKAKLMVHTSTTNLPAVLNHKVSAVPEAVGIVLVVIVAIVVLVVASPVYQAGGKTPVSDPFEAGKD
jgi:hypothetical protein